MNKICKFCNKSFKPNYKPQVFCSLSCTSKYGWTLKKRHRATWLTIVCPICSKKFKEKTSRTKDGRGKFCSKACYAEALKKRTGWHHSLKTKLKMSRKSCGKRNSAFKHGNSGNYIRYKSTFPRRLKEQIKKRDGY